VLQVLDEHMSLLFRMVRWYRPQSQIKEAISSAEQSSLAKKWWRYAIKVRSVFVCGGRFLSFSS
jgi:hypothetical protein